MKTLVVYYSLSCGNTARIAKMIAEHLTADIVSIETVKPYTGSYNDIVDQGQREVEEGYTPDIKPLSVNLSDYDRVIIGTPTWWYTMAPAVRTFLERGDFTGKTVIPFQTHGGWPGHTLADMKNKCKGARFADEKAICFDSTGGDRLITPLEEIREWIENIA